MNLKIDVDYMVEFLAGLLNTPSPTGDTDRAIEYVSSWLSKLAERLPMVIEKTPKGTLICTIEGEQSDAPRALTAHVDTLGAMVQEFQKDGRLRMSKLGGWSWSSVEGEGVTIFASSGQTYRGTILPAAASVHAHTSKEREAIKTDADMVIRIDALTQSEKETKALGIRVGDFVAFDPRVEISDAGFVRSRHLDDKASVATIFAALSAMADAELRPVQRTTIHISNYEEVGHGGAAGFPADLAELVVVDMAVVAPRQTSDEFSVTICAKDAGGPYHLELRRQLEKLAESNQLRHVTDIYRYYNSDGTAYWRAGGNVRVGLIGPGVDASHHYERTHRDALENTARLIAAYLLN